MNELDPGLEIIVSFPPHEIGVAPDVSGPKKITHGIPFVLAPTLVSGISTLPGWNFFL